MKKYIRLIRLYYLQYKWGAELRKLYRKEQWNDKTLYRFIHEDIKKGERSCESYWYIEEYRVIHGSSILIYDFLQEIKKEIDKLKNETRN